jgi:hypothetical protein
MALMTVLTVVLTAVSSMMTLTTLSMNRKINGSVNAGIVDGETGEDFDEIKN